LAPLGTASHRLAPHHTASHRITPHHTASHRITPHHTASHRITPRHTAPHRTARQTHRHPLFFAIKELFFFDVGSHFSPPSRSGSFWTNHHFHNDAMK
jgi:hypothetical protein